MTQPAWARAGGRAALAAGVLGAGATVFMLLTLLAGVCVLVPLQPLIYAPFAIGRLALGVWSMLSAWLGVVLIRWANRRRAAGDGSMSPTLVAAASRTPR